MSKQNKGTDITRHPGWTNADALQRFVLTSGNIGYEAQAVEVDSTGVAKVEKELGATDEQHHVWSALFESEDTPNAEPLTTAPSLVSVLMADSLSPIQRWELWLEQLTEYDWLEWPVSSTVNALQTARRYRIALRDPKHNVFGEVCKRLRNATTEDCDPSEKRDKENGFHIHRRCDWQQFMDGQIRDIYGDDALTQETASKRKVPEACYDHQRGCYWVINMQGKYHRVSGETLDGLLCQAGFERRAEGGQSEVERERLKIVHNHSVDAALPLAGHRRGLVQVQDKRVLVTSGLNLLEPRPGKWPTIRTILEGLLGAEDQALVVKAILKRDYGALLAGHLHVQGQATALIGPADCGKSMFIRLVVVPLLGGRAARCYKYMAGKTTFNGEWSGCETLLIDDEIAYADLEARRAFGARIKDIVGQQLQAVEDKNVRALGLYPFWRLWIACNDEPEALRLMPPLDESLRPKLHLLRCFNFELPMPAELPEERQAFASAVQAELPAFADYLLNLKVPSDHRDRRFGVSTWHEAKLFDALAELSAEAQLLSLVDQYRFTAGRTNVLDRYQRMMDDEGVNGYDATKPWIASATEIERFLRDQCERKLDKIATFQGAVGTYLSRLRKSKPERVDKDHTTTGNVWTIQPPTKRQREVEEKDENRPAT